MTSSAIAIETTGIPQIETLHPDVVAFCTLIARIYYRVLIEQDSHVMAMIATPIAEIEACTVEESEVAREAA